MSIILISLAFTLCLTGTSIIFILYLKFLEVTEISEILVVRHWKTSSVRYQQYPTNMINMFPIQTEEVKEDKEEIKEEVKEDKEEVKEEVKEVEEVKAVKEVKGPLTSPLTSLTSSYKRKLRKLRAP